MCVRKLFTGVVLLSLGLGACEDAASGSAPSLDAGLDAASFDASAPDAARADDAGAQLRDASLDAALVGDPAPLYAEAATFQTTIPGHADPADVYYPLAASAPLPIALLLQGANVARVNYAGYARRIARYGFIVVVPDHATLLGLFPEQQQVLDTLAFLRSENTRADGPLRGRVDVDTLVLLGHSFGGVAALGAVRGSCDFPFCNGSYTRPTALRAAALYGTNYGDAPPMLEHDGVGVALLQGALDGAAAPSKAQATYEALRTPPRALFTLPGANHYGLCDVNNPSGAAADDSAPTLPQAELVARTADLAATFLRAVLGDGKQEAWLRNNVADAGGSDASFALSLDLP